MSRQDPSAATGQLPSERSAEAVDWSRYQKCQACFTELGEPCWALAGAVAVGGGVIRAFVAADRPHGGRKLRAVARGAVSR